MCVFGLSTDSFCTSLMLLFLHVVFVLGEGFYIVMLKAPTHYREVQAGLLPSWQAGLVLLRS